jgi:serpin B
MTDTKQAAIASNRFALDMYRELANRDGNLFFSPWSLNTALAMTYEGARGKTADEMRSVLHFYGDESTRRQSFFALDQRIIDDKSGYTLSTANALWVDNNFSLLDGYMDLMDCIYHARATNLDFMGASDDARKTINFWVEQKTSQKIKDLIPPPYIDPSTCLVLTNAIYFKGTWVKEFDKSLTRDEKFFSGEGRTVYVSMMRRLDEDAKFDYMETEDIQMLQMPYLGEKLSLVILLPKEPDITKVESSLSVEKLAQWRKGLERQRIDVYIPKFKIDAKYFLAENLQNLGMPTAFSGADFSGMSAGGGGLYISQVIHQAYVDVNEEGTEATAATAVIMSRSIMMGPRTPVFRADHPFIFMIQDEETGCILFLGRVSDPGTQ